jgi:hypothetical protein
VSSKPATGRYYLTVLAIAAAASAAVAPRAATPRFFPDDPIQVDNDRALDASDTKPIEGSNAYDFAENTFLHPGDTRDIRAVNVNSIDEVPDSSWFTNRIGRRAMTAVEIARGPIQQDISTIDDWPIIQEKSSGITPGYRVIDPKDPSRQRYQVKFDPPSNPEMASAAEVIGAAIYHAVGYNVVQGYIVEIDPARIVIAPTATTVDMSGRKRPMTRKDVDRLLARAARLPNGKYRATLSRFAEGENRGYFKYYGTRPDDPNDIHPHEHRRELRANRVFAAWLNHDDSRGINSLDMLQDSDRRKYIRHYMFDFGSIMGSGSTSPQTLRAGNEYILEWAPALKTLATFGVYVRPWIRTKYWEGAKSVGRFEGDVFDPVAWRPEYPNPAFDNMRADDALWGARLVSRFSDEAIRAVVAKGGYREPGAADHIINTLIKRRDKVLRAWLTGVNPLADARLGTDGVLEFENAAVSARVTSAPSRYTLRWSEFDNATNATTGAPVETTATEPRATAPPALLGPGRRSPISGAQFVTVAIRTTHPDYPVWDMPVTFTFRRASNGWQTVGVDRVVPARKPR